MRNPSASSASLGFPLLAIAVALLARPAAGATAFLALGPDLKPQRIAVHAIQSGKLAYLDHDRQLRSEELAQYVQLRLAGPPAAAALEPAATGGGAAATLAGPRVTIETSDGQVLHGKWFGVAGDGQAIKLQHPVLGNIAVDLEKISRASLDGRARPASATPAKDQLLLANGDVVQGFVTAVGDDRITLQADGKRTISLPRERVLAMTLANPVRRKREMGHLVTLADGVRVCAKELTVADDVATLVTWVRPEAVRLPLGQVARIDIATPLGELVDLTDLPVAVTSGGEVFGAAMPPRVVGGALALHAPVKVRFKLPAGATRLAATAALPALDDDGAPLDAAALAWTHFTATFATGQHPPVAITLAAGQAPTPFNIPLGGDALTLELDAGRNGPVMDRLRLVDGVVFVARK